MIGLVDCLRSRLCSLALRDNIVAFHDAAIYNKRGMLRDVNTPLGSPVAVGYTG